MRLVSVFEFFKLFPSSFFSLDSRSIISDYITTFDILTLSVNFLFCIQRQDFSFELIEEPIILRERGMFINFEKKRFPISQEHVLIVLPTENQRQVLEDIIFRYNIEISKRTGFKIVKLPKVSESPIKEE